MDRTEQQIEWFNKQYRDLAGIVELQLEVTKALRSLFDDKFVMGFVADGKEYTMELSVLDGPGHGKERMLACLEAINNNSKMANRLAAQTHAVLKRLHSRKAAAGK